MKAVTKVTFLDEQGEKFFGEGPARLLRAVERHGSLPSSPAPPAERTAAAAH